MDILVPILSYGPRQSVVALTLDNPGDRVRVIFPVAPKWVYILPIMVQFAVALFSVGMMVRLVEIIRTLVPVPAAFTMIRPVLIELTMQAMFLGALGAHQWWMYRRWGRVSRMLTADENGLVLSRLGWLRMREKSWPAQEITAIELCPVIGNLNRWRTVADLYVRRSRGFRLHFRLSSADAQLPDRIAHELAAALHRPLAQK